MFAIHVKNFGDHSYKRRDSANPIRENPLKIHVIRVAQ